jgi:predicted nucleic acid-binding protein
VLTEVANSLTRGSDRALFLELYRDLADDPRVTIVPPAQDLFEQGIGLFAKRPDKEWSLTDCISFIVMREYGLTDALTADRHFEQAGFKILLS